MNEEQIGNILASLTAEEKVILLSMLKGPERTL